MHSSISIKDAQSKLQDLIHAMSPGDEVVITENNQPVARLIPTAAKPPRRFGALKGTVLYMAPDFDGPLDDFKEYMQ